MIRYIIILEILQKLKPAVRYEIFAWHPNPLQQSATLEFLILNGILGATSCNMIEWNNFAAKQNSRQKSSVTIIIFDLAGMLIYSFSKDFRNNSKVLNDKLTYSLYLHQIALRWFVNWSWNLKSHDIILNNNYTFSL